MSSPLLSKPSDGETLYVYLVVFDGAISATLVREDAGVQKPVYYISKALLNSESKYQKLEKLAFALLITSRKLKHYFQSFPITVLTEYSLKSILRNLQATGRISKWATELGAYHIQYEPCTSIKGQVMADFVVEFTLNNSVLTLTSSTPDMWTFYVDGASNSKRAGLE